MSAPRRTHSPAQLADENVASDGLDQRQLICGEAVETEFFERYALCHGLGAVGVSMIEKKRNEQAGRKQAHTSRVHPCTSKYSMSRHFWFSTKEETINVHITYPKRPISSSLVSHRDHGHSCRGPSGGGVHIFASSQCVVSLHSCVSSSTVFSVLVDVCVSCEVC